MSITTKHETVAAIAIELNNFIAAALCAETTTAYTWNIRQYISFISYIPVTPITLLYFW